MSFKRDGNDSGLLKNLQHRRVAEILGDHIPDDEASLLSNGRLTCTVCSKRPIFDTMQMLSLHRKGKKHLLELSRYLQHKQDLEIKKVKQTQISFLKTDQVSIKNPATNSSLPLVGFSLSYTKKKRFSNLSNRKFILDITESCDRLKSNTITSSTPISPSSANSQVRKYLKSLSRKRPLEKTVNKLRENYGTVGTHSKPALESKTQEKKQESCNPSNKHKSEYRIKLLESGWIQDSNGKWMKNPDVEFDSDEEDPPSFC